MYRLIFKIKYYVTHNAFGDTHICSKYFKLIFYKYPLTLITIYIIIYNNNDHNNDFNFKDVIVLECLLQFVKIHTHSPYISGFQLVCEQINLFCFGMFFGFSCNVSCIKEMCKKDEVTAIH